MKRAALALVIVAALASSAQADEATVHPGEHVLIVNAKGKVKRRLDATTAALYVIERDTAVSCNVAHRRVWKLADALSKSTQTANRLARTEPGWKVAARWAFWSLTVTAAFAAGGYLF